MLEVCCAASSRRRRRRGGCAGGSPGCCPPRFHGRDGAGFTWHELEALTLSYTAHALCYVRYPSVGDQLAGCALPFRRPCAGLPRGSSRPGPLAASGRDYGWGAMPSPARPGDTAVCDVRCTCILLVCTHTYPWLISGPSKASAALFLARVPLVRIAAGARDHSGSIRGLERAWMHHRVRLRAAGARAAGVACSAPRRRPGGCCPGCIASRARDGGGRAARRQKHRPACGLHHVHVHIT